MATLRELIIKISANSQSFQSEIQRASRMGSEYYRTLQNVCVIHFIILHITETHCLCTSAHQSSGKHRLSTTIYSYLISV